MSGLIEPNSFRRWRDILDNCCWFAPQDWPHSHSQFLGDHRHAGSIPAGVENRNLGGVAATGVGRPLLPPLRLLANPLHHALNLPGRDFNAAGLLQMPFGFEKGRLIGPFQAKEFGQSRGITDFQTQRRVGGRYAAATA